MNFKIKSSIKLIVYVIIAAVAIGCSGTTTPTDSTPPTIESVVTTSVNTIKITFSEALSETSVTSATYAISPSLGTVTSPTYDSSDNSIEITTTDDMQATGYTITVTGVEDTSSNTEEVTESFQGDARPKIIQVNSVDSDTIAIQFNENVVLDSLSATISDNISVDEVDGGASLTLHATTPYILDTDDNSIVYINFDATTPQLLDEPYKVTLQIDGTSTFGFKDTNGNFLLENTGYFKGIAPFGVTSATAISPTQVIVTLSEPLLASDAASNLTTANIKIMDESTNIVQSAVLDTNDSKKIIITTSLQSQKSYTLEMVIGTYNFHSSTYVSGEPNDDTMQSGYNTASFTGDGLPEVKSAAAIDSTHVKVIFSEPVDITTAETNSNYSITSATTTNLSIVNIVRSNAPNTNEVIIETSAQKFANYTVTVNNVKDIDNATTDDSNDTISGNNTALFAGSGIDSFPPSILTASAISETQVRLYFNEPIETSTAQTSTNYTLENLSKATLIVTGAPVSGEQISVNANSVTLTLTATNGTEDSANGIFKMNASNNQLIAYSIVKAINTMANSPVRAYLGTAVWDGAENDYKIELISKTFGTNGDITLNLDPDTNGNITNVSINSAATTAVSLNASSPTVSAGNSAQVDMSFATSVGTNGQLWQLTVAGVTDTNANAMASTTKTLVMLEADATAPKLVGIYSVDTKNVKLLFDEPVDQTTATNINNYWFNNVDTAYMDKTGVDFDSGDSMTITYDGGSTYTITASGSTSYPSNTFKASGTQINAFMDLLQNDPDSPVYAYLENTEDVFLVRKKNYDNTGTIDSITFTHATNPDMYTVAITQPVATQNNGVTSASYNPTFSREITLTLNTPITDGIGKVYNVIAKSISDISSGDVYSSGYDTRISLPVDTNIGTPSGDTTAPTIVFAESLSDSMTRVVFSEEIKSSSISVSNFDIRDPDGTVLIIDTATLDTNSPNSIILKTSLQSPLTYTLTIKGNTGLTDVAATPNEITSDQSLTFSGMGSISPDNGPVGNTIGGIGNVNNKAITAMVVHNDKLYIATWNKGNSYNQTEIFESDQTGVYFTRVNNPAFYPDPQTFTVKQDVTSSLVAHDSKIFAITGKSPSGNVLLYSQGGTSLSTDGWTWENSQLVNTTTLYWDFGGSNVWGTLASYGLTSKKLYVSHASDIHIYNSTNDFGTQSAPISLSGQINKMIAFGGKLYVAVDGLTVWRSKGANADAPATTSDFEKILDSNALTTVGMDNYDDDDTTDDNHAADSANTAAISMETFNGYIYIGTTNANGAQIWRSFDGQIWERVLDFGNGTSFNGLGITGNTSIMTLKTNGSYLYAGTENSSGAQVWRSPDGVTWQKFGTDGFGTTSFTKVTAMESFNELIYFGMENSDGGAIFRASN